MNYPRFVNTVALARASERFFDTAFRAAAGGVEHPGSVAQRVTSERGVQAAKAAWDSLDRADYEAALAAFEEAEAAYRAAPRAARKAEWRALGRARSAVQKMGGVATQAALNVWTE